jgi:ribosomal-protein-alanine N-acetyltransferase
VALQFYTTEMRREDIDQVLVIEKASFPSPWERKAFESELENPNARNIVVKEKKTDKTERVVAYVCFRCVTDEIHIVNIAVLPEYRRRGIGAGLLQAVIAEARQQPCEEIVLEVRATNQSAILFYKKFGFKIVGRLPAYYSESGEDALLMSFTYKTKIRKE